MRRFGELDVVIADDLDAIAPRIAEVEEPAGNDVHTRIRERRANGFLVVDDEAEVSAVVGALCPPFLEREELVAEVDEGSGVAPAAQGEVEQATVERQRLVNVTDLEGNVIEADGRAFLASGMATLQPTDRCSSALIRRARRQAGRPDVRTADLHAVPRRRLRVVGGVGVVLVEPVHHPTADQRNELSLDRVGDLLGVNLLAVDIDRERLQVLGLLGRVSIVVLVQA